MNIKWVLGGSYALAALANPCAGGQVPSPASSRAGIRQPGRVRGVAGRASGVMRPPGAVGERVDGFAGDGVHASSPRSVRQALFNDVAKGAQVGLQLGLRRAREEIPGSIIRNLVVAGTVGALQGLAEKTLWTLDVPPSKTKSWHPVRLPGGLDAKIGPKGGRISAEWVKEVSPGAGGKVVFTAPPDFIVEKPFTKWAKGWFQKAAANLVDAEVRQMTVETKSPHAATITKSFTRTPWGGKMEVMKPVPVPPLDPWIVARDFVFRTAIDLAGAVIFRR